MELERKILLLELPQGLENPEQIIQAYIYTEPFELRIRKQGSKCSLAYKSPGDEERHEWEIEIPCWLFDELITKHVGIIIEKNRYTVYRDGYCYEIDEYQSPHQGLIVAEIEFKRKTDYESYKPPTWLGETQDITHDQRYKNKKLSSQNPIRYR